MSTVAEIEDFGAIHGPEGTGIKVPEHTDATRRRAAAELLSGMYGVEDEDAIEWLSGKAIKSTFREHTTDPYESACENDCEAIGWRCEYGEGEPEPFWWFDSIDARKVADSAPVGGAS